jgi:hypothetical protein
MLGATSQAQGKKSNFIGCVGRAVQRRWLECVRAWALRTPLAGLLKFATAFCGEAKMEFRGLRFCREIRGQREGQAEFAAGFFVAG